LAGLRIAASKQDIKSVVTSGQDLIFSLAKEHSSKLESLFAKVSGKIRFPEPGTVYLRLPKNYFEPRTLITVLRKILGEEKNE